MLAGIVSEESFISEKDIVDGKGPNGDELGLDRRRNILL